jgi:hypothetical protein
VVQSYRNIIHMGQAYQNILQVVQSYQNISRSRILSVQKCDCSHCLHTKRYNHVRMVLKILKQRMLYS